MIDNSSRKAFLLFVARCVCPIALCGACQLTGILGYQPDTGSSSGSASGGSASSGGGGSSNTGTTTIGGAGMSGGAGAAPAIGGQGGSTVCDGPIPEVLWLARAPLVEPDQVITSAVLDDAIHVFGYTHYRWHRIYDPGSDTWTQKVDLPPDMDASEGAAAVVDGTLWAFDQGSFLNGNALKWNSVEDIWQVNAADPWPRRLSATGVIDGKVYMAGGFAGNDDKTNVYDPATNKWADLAPIDVLAGGANTGVVYGGNLYVLGVVDGGFGATRVEVYNPSADTWTEKTALPVSRYGGRAILRGSAIWLLGGSENGTVVTTIHIYDIEADTWCLGPSIPEPLQFFAVQQVGGKIYLIGGMTTDLVPMDHVWKGFVVQ